MNTRPNKRKIPRWYRQWARRQRRLKKSLLNSMAHRLLGERIFMAEIWKIDRFRLANGLALGLFIAFTPTIPFQMLLCVIGAIILQVNLPIALAACWLTNPLTAIPVFLAAHKLGKYILENTTFEAYTLTLFRLYEKTGGMLRESLYLWTGSLIFALTAAVVGNLLVHLMFDLGRRYRSYKLKKSGASDTQVRRIEW